jgi:hypothetical protein
VHDGLVRRALTGQQLGDVEGHTHMGGADRLVGDGGCQTALQVGLLHILRPAPDGADQMIGPERVPPGVLGLLGVCGILDHGGEGDERAGADRVGHRRGHTHLAEEAIECLVQRQLGPEAADEFDGLHMVRIGERFPGAGEQHLEAQTGRRRIATDRHDSGRGHISSNLGR